VLLNTATAQELETLPNIGPSRAKAIIEYREKNGPFARVDDLTNVSGIGTGILESLRDLVEVR
jgi:competence protein ComEA